MLNCYRNQHLLEIFLVMLMCAFAPTSEAAEDADNQQTPPPEKVFARVNDQVVTTKDFEALYAATLRKRFYHGKTQDGQTEAVRKDVTDLLVDRALMLDDARQRALQPENDKIEKEISGYDARYAKSEMWKKQRDQLLPGVRAKLVQESLIAQVERIYRDVPNPSSNEVKAYYDSHPELFTEPEKVRLSLILLKVDPSAPAATWAQAEEEGRSIFKRIKNGADFSEMARLHSSDPSASRGGDIGYVHRGMLPEAMHEKIDKSPVGNVSDPITLLEGIALVRLDERIASRLRDFTDVESRARELLIRDREDLALKEAMARLRNNAKVEIMPSLAESHL